MRIVELTEQEAANPAVMKNVKDFLLTGSAEIPRAIAAALGGGVVTTTELAPVPIAPNDRPDAGLPPLPGAPNSAAHAPAQPVTLPPATPDPALIGFGQKLVDAASVGFGTGGTGSALPQPPAAPAPATPNVPAAPAPAADPNANVPSSGPAGVQVDKRGFPWKAEIHSSTKAMNKDGTWRRRQGVSDELVAQVEAQLKQVMAIPSPSPVPPAPAPAPAAGVPMTPETALAMATGADPFLSLPDDQKFKAWMTELAPAMAAMHITPEFIQQHLEQPLGVYATRGDLVPQAREKLRNALRQAFPSAGY